MLSLGRHAFYTNSVNNRAIDSPKSCRLARSYSGLFRPNILVARIVLLFSLVASLVL